MKVIRRGNVHVTVFLDPLKKGDRVIPRWRWRWKDSLGKWRSGTRSSKSQAHEAAAKLAEDLAKLKAQADLHPADADRSRRAVLLAAESGRPHDDIVADYMAACREAQANGYREDVWRPGFLSEAARYYARSTPQTRGLSASETVERFLESKRSRKLISTRHEADLKGRLTRFAEKFPEPLSEILPVSVTEWLSKGLGKVNNRSRNNYLGAVQNLFNWARKEKLVTAALQAEIQEIEKWVSRPGEIVLWKPKEIAKVLEAALLPYRDSNGTVRSDAGLVPYLALGAFAKVRSEELRKLHWEDIDLDHEPGEVVITRLKAKTRRTRRVTMPANLRAWLLPFRKASGPVCPFEKPPTLHKACRRVVERAGFKWRKNALRQSGISYHYLLTGDLARVTAEAGNSPQIAQSNYIELRKTHMGEAAEWFEVYPPVTTGKVLPFALTK